MLALVVFALVVFILPFAFPTPPPIVTRFGATQLFSPDGDGARDVARVSVRMRERGTLSIDVADGDRVLRTLARDRAVRPGWSRLAWDGRDDAGRPVPDGSYALRLRARAGAKVFNTSRRIRVDTTPPGLEDMTAGPGEASECVVRVTPAEPASLVLEARPAAARAGGAPLRRLGPRPVGAGGLEWSWDGRRTGGRAVAPGLYAVRATLRDPARNATGANRTCWVGHVRGTAAPAPARPGDLVGVRLRRADGGALPPGTRVRLRLHRRAGTPGPDARVLGPRVARAVSGPAGRVRIRLPRARRVDALWLVAATPEGVALIDPAAGP